MNNFCDKHLRKTSLREGVECYGSYSMNYISDYKVETVYNNLTDRLSTRIEGGVLSVDEGSYRKNFEKDINELARLRNILIVPNNAFPYVVEENVAFMDALRLAPSETWINTEQLKSFFEENNDIEALNAIIGYRNKSIFVADLKEMLDNNNVDVEESMNGFEGVSQGIEKTLNIFQRLRVGMSNNRAEEFYNIVTPDRLEKPPLDHIIKQDKVKNLYEEETIIKESFDVLINSPANLITRASDHVHRMTGHRGNFRNYIPTEEAMEKIEYVTERYKNLMDTVHDRIDFEQNTIYISILYIAMDSFSRRKMYGSKNISSYYKASSFVIFTGKSVGLVAGGQTLEKIQYSAIDKYLVSEATGELLKELIDKNPYLNIKLIKTIGTGLYTLKQTNGDYKQAGEVVANESIELCAMAFLIFKLGLFGMPVYIAGKYVLPFVYQMRIDEKYQGMLKDHLYQQALESTS